MLLPGVSTLARLVARVRDAAMQRLWDTLAAPLTAAQPELMGLAGAQDQVLSAGLEGPSSLVRTMITPVPYLDPSSGRPTPCSTRPV